MTHKEFYIWLEGYLHGKLENKNVEIGPIVKKMGEVKDEPQESIKITPFERIPIPVNPFPNTANPTIDPFTPPWTITCNTEQLND